MRRIAVHLPVLERETLELLGPRPGETVVDATLGLGGHAEALLRAIGPSGRLIGIDRDPAALALARERLAPFGAAFVAIHADHRELPQRLAERGIERVDRILFDLGVSSLQLDDPERGFSLVADGPLDMRMNPETGATAADLLAELPERELKAILHRFGEERRAGAIARALVRQRERQPLTRTLELANLVASVLGPAARRYRIHPATRTFQALRVAVNGELDGLEQRLLEVPELLVPGGRIAVIAFHSLEDRAVKRAFRTLAHRCVCPPDLPRCGCGRTDSVRVVTTRPVRPGAAEVEANPRSRSARLRVAEKL